MNPKDICSFSKMKFCGLGGSKVVSSGTVQDWLHFGFKREKHQLSRQAWKPKLLDRVETITSFKRFQWQKSNLFSTSNTNVLHGGAWMVFKVCTVILLLSVALIMLVRCFQGTWFWLIYCKSVSIRNFDYFYCVFIWIEMTLLYAFYNVALSMNNWLLKPPLLSHVCIQTDLSKGRILLVCFHLP